MTRACCHVVLGLPLLVLVLVTLTFGQLDPASDEIAQYRTDHEHDPSSREAVVWRARRGVKQKSKPATVDEDDDEDDVDDEDGDDEDDDDNNNVPKHSTSPNAPGLETDTDDPQGIFHTLDSLRAMQPGPGVQYRQQMPLYPKQQPQDEDAELELIKDRDTIPTKITNVPSTSRQKRSHRRNRQKRSYGRRNWLRRHKEAYMKSEEGKQNDDDEWQVVGGEKMSSRMSNDKRDGQQVGTGRKNENSNDPNSLELYQTDYFKDNKNVDVTPDIKDQVKKTKNASGLVVANPTSRDSSNTATFGDRDDSQRLFTNRLPFGRLSEYITPSSTRAKPTSLNRGRRQIVSGADSDLWSRRSSSNGDESDDESEESYNNDDDYYSRSVDGRRAEKRASRMFFDPRGMEQSSEKRSNYVHHFPRTKPSKKELAAQRWLEKELKLIENESRAIQKKADILNHKMKGINLINSSTRRRPGQGRKRNEYGGYKSPIMFNRHEHQHNYNYGRPMKMKLRLLQLENELHSLRSKMRAQEIYEGNSEEDEDVEEFPKLSSLSFTDTGKKSYDNEEEEEDEEQKRYKRAPLQYEFNKNKQWSDGDIGFVQSSNLRTKRSMRDKQSPSMETDLQSMYRLLKSNVYHNEQMAHKLRRGHTNTHEELKDEQNDSPKTKAQTKNSIDKSLEKSTDNNDTLWLQEALASKYAALSKRRNPYFGRNSLSFAKAANSYERGDRKENGEMEKTSGNVRVRNAMFFKNGRVIDEKNTGAISDSHGHSSPELKASESNAKEQLSHNHLRLDDRRTSDSSRQKNNDHVDGHDGTPYNVALTIKWLEILNKTWPPRTPEERAMVASVLEKINIMTDDLSKVPLRQYEVENVAASSYYNSDESSNANTDGQTNRFFTRNSKQRDRFPQQSNGQTHGVTNIPELLDKIFRSGHNFFDRSFQTSNQRAESQQPSGLNDPREIGLQSYKQDPFKGKHRQFGSVGSHIDTDKQNRLLKSMRKNKVIEILNSQLHRCRKKVINLNKSLAVFRKQTRLVENNANDVGKSIYEPADNIFERLQDMTNSEIKKDTVSSPPSTSLNFLHRKEKSDQKGHQQTGSSDLQLRKSFKLVENERFLNRDSPENINDGDRFDNMRHNRIHMRPENLLDVFGESRRRKRSASNVDEKHSRGDVIDNEITMKNDLIALLSRLPPTTEENKAKQSLRQEDEQLKNSASVARAVLRLQDEEDNDAESGVYMAESWVPLLRKRRHSLQNYEEGIKTQGSKEAIHLLHDNNEKPDVYAIGSLGENPKIHASKRRQKRKAGKGKKGHSKDKGKDKDKEKDKDKGKDKDGSGSGERENLDEYLDWIEEEIQRLSHKGAHSMDRPEPDHWAPHAHPGQGYHRGPEAYPGSHPDGHGPYYPQTHPQPYDDMGMYERDYGPRGEGHLSRGRRDIAARLAHDQSDYLNGVQKGGSADDDDDTVDAEGFVQYDEGEGDDNDVDDDETEEDDDETKGGQKEIEKVEVKENGRDVPEKDDFAFLEKKMKNKHKTETYSWGSWSPCSVTCGLGERVRSNLCGRGQPCTGRDASTEVEVCSEKDIC